MLCRACAEECDEYKFLHVEGIILNNVTTLAMLLNFCVGLDFSEEDEYVLPEQICIPCMQKLAKACAFKQMVLDVNEFFRNTQHKIHCEDEEREEGNEELVVVEVEEITAEELSKLETDAKLQQELANNEDQTPGPDNGRADETAMTEEVVTQNKIDEKLEAIIEDVADVEKVEETLERLLQEDGIMHKVDEKHEATVEDESVGERVEQTLEMMLGEVTETIEVDHEILYQDAQDEEDGPEFHLEVVEAEEVEVAEPKETKNQPLDTTDGAADDMLAVKVFNFKQLHEDSEEIAVYSGFDNDADPEPNHSADLDLNQSSEQELSHRPDSELSKSSEAELTKYTVEFCENPEEENSTLPLNVIQVKQFEVEMDESMDSNEKSCGSSEPKSNEQQDDGKVKKPTNKDPNLKCQVCGKYFKSTKTYRSHMKRHNPFNPKACEFCGKTYRELDTLEKHLLSHTGEKPLACGICGRNFRFRSNLLAHIRQHTGEKPFKCTQCDRCFGTKRHLTRHAAVHSDERPYSCDLCGKTFAQLRYLELHKFRHTGVKPCQCHICGKSLSRNSELKKHFLTHTGEKPYQCDICGRYYRDQTNLRVHKRMHTGDRPYECPYCEKNYLTSTQLKAHTMIHTGERPHTCDVCGKSYRVLRSLQRHMLTHTGVKQFKCDICAFEFRYESNLIAHKRLHDRAVAKCTHCEKTFRTPKLLSRHISVRHTQSETSTKRKPRKRLPKNKNAELALKPLLPDIVDQKISKSNIVELY